MRKEPKQPDQKSGNHGSRGTADAAFQRFVWAHQWGDFMLAETDAAEQCKGVTSPGGKCPEYQSFQPDIADADHHQYAENNARIGETGNRVNGTRTGYFFMDDAREHGKVNTAGKAGNVADCTEMKDREQRLNADIDIHDPRRTVDVKLFHVAAVLIGTENARNAKQQNPRDLR